MWKIFKISHVLMILAVGSSLQGQQTKIILDADTGNEVDDLFAIVRALIEPSWDILALNAAQWQNSQWAVDNTMEESHRLNHMLVNYLRMEKEIKTLRGGVNRMYDWGDKAQHSAAAYGIIKQANRLPENEFLSVVVLGALTNVASALYIDPGIAGKIKVYWLGLSYDFEKGTSKRIDFNAVMDPQAADLLLSSEVEMHLIPVNVAAAMKFGYEETHEQFDGIHPLTEFLVDRWYRHMDGSRYQRTIWDVALIEAMIHPEWAREVRVETFENPNIWIYSEINATSMKEDFFRTTVDYAKRLGVN